MSPHQETSRNIISHEITSNEIKPQFTYLSLIKTCAESFNSTALKHTHTLYFEVL